MQGKIAALLLFLVIIYGVFLYSKYTATPTSFGKPTVIDMLLDKTYELLSNMEKKIFGKKEVEVNIPELELANVKAEIRCVQKLARVCNDYDYVISGDIVNVGTVTAKDAIICCLFYDNETKREVPAGRNCISMALEYSSKNKVFEIKPHSSLNFEFSPNLESTYLLRYPNRITYTCFVDSDMVRAKKMFDDLRKHIIG